MTDLDTTKLCNAHTDSTMGSHWEGCEYVHPECAIVRLCTEVDVLRAKLEKAQNLQDRSPSYQ